MENTQENPTDQTTEETGREAQAAENAAPAAEAALAEAQAKIAELQESFLRAKAETENVRRRAQDDVAKAHKFAIESFAENLLPVLDSLEAAVGDTRVWPAHQQGLHAWGPPEPFEACRLFVVRKPNDRGLANL